MNLEPSLGSYLFDESRIGAAGELVPAWVEDVLTPPCEPSSWGGT
jgi:NAD-dependent deacetylase